VIERSISHSSIDVLAAVLPRPGNSRSIDDDIQPLAGKALGDERSGYAAADDQGIAFDVLASTSSRMAWSAVAYQANGHPKVGLFGIL